MLLLENEVAWTAYRLIASQPLVAPMGGVYGFNFQVVEFVFRMLSLPEDEWAETFSKLLVVDQVAALRRNKPVPPVILPGQHLIRPGKVSVD